MQPKSSRRFSVTLMKGKKIKQKEQSKKCTEIDSRRAMS